MGNATDRLIHGHHSVARTDSPMNLGANDTMHLGTKSTKDIYREVVEGNHFDACNVMPSERSVCHPKDCLRKDAHKHAGWNRFPTTKLKITNLRLGGRRRAMVRRRSSRSSLSRNNWKKQRNLALQMMNNTIIIRSDVETMNNARRRTLTCKRRRCG